MTKLILVRGLPGSGKSTYARRYEPYYVHLEADMWFMFEGIYQFNSTQLGSAHQWCQTTTRVLLQTGRNVIVSNTFTTKKELEPYLSIAADAGAEVEIYRCVADYGSIHNVPEEAIERMANRFVDVDGEIIYDSFDESEDV